MCRSLFVNKVAGLGILWRDSNKCVISEFCEIFKNTNFEEHLPTAAPDYKSVFCTLLTGKSHETREYFTIDK